jgi:hypothetical protein
MQVGKEVEATYFVNDRILYDVLHSYCLSALPFSNCIQQKDDSLSTNRGICPQLHLEPLRSKVPSQGSTFPHTLEQLWRKHSEMVCVISIRPELLRQHSYSKHTHW